MIAKQWTGQEDNVWQPVGSTCPELPPGIYSIDYSRSPFGESWALRAIQVSHDNIIKLGVCDYMWENIHKFWASKERYTSLGFRHKRGFLLAGPPGTGKTIAAMLMCSMVASHKGVAIMGHSRAYVTAMILHAIRQVHPMMPIVVVWEDIDRIAGDSDDENIELLSVLDGEKQVDNIVHIATTNYVERLGMAFVNRPGRFDDIIWVDAPSRDVRLQYIRQLVPNEPEGVIHELAKKSDGLRLSHLKDMLVSIFILGHSVDSTISRFKAMMETEAKAKDPSATLAKILGAKVA